MNINVNATYEVDKKSGNLATNSLADILSIKIDDKKFLILKKSDSKTEGERMGIKITNTIPVFFLKGTWKNKWWYHPEINFILVFENTWDDNLKHELIHSIEFKKEKNKELYLFYDKVKNIINEDSFSWFVTFNFTKNIHEFIADWYSKDPFINAMKKEKLYDEFIQKTKYLFEE